MQEDVCELQCLRGRVRLTDSPHNTVLPKDRYRSRQRDQYRSFATLSVEVYDLSLARGIHLWPMGSDELPLADFMWVLANRRHGWSGALTWVDASGTVTLAAVHDGIDHVGVKVTAFSYGVEDELVLGVGSNGWRAEAVFTIGTWRLEDNARAVSAFLIGQ